MVLNFSLLFVAFLLLMVGLKYWLALRQIRHVSTHADRVPAQFADRIPLDAHRRAPPTPFPSSAWAWCRPPSAPRCWWR